MGGALLHQRRATGFSSNTRRVSGTVYQGRNPRDRNIGELNGAVVESF